MMGLQLVDGAAAATVWPGLVAAAQAVVMAGLVEHPPASLQLVFSRWDDGWICECRRRGRFEGYVRVDQ